MVNYPSLPRSFYTRSDVVLIARELLGKYLMTRFDDQVTGGIIVETEAYEGENDRASHAYGKRRTIRTEIMYRIGGTAYIYLCYGVHSLFNIVTNDIDIPHAVLIRGIRPVEGINTMLSRTEKKNPGKNFGIGPGVVSKALGIHFSQTGIDLTNEQFNRPGSAIWLEDRGVNVDPGQVLVTSRIGVEYSGEDALRPNRFVLPL
ncbi:MAG: DNA-3-methyladenine glycosylase [Bacteroidetes bacterium]|nr:DNA-3-methyladenine glycosylase [Bacteroidota bacterium]